MSPPTARSTAALAASLVSSDRGHGACYVGHGGQSAPPLWMHSLVMRMTVGKVIYFVDRHFSDSTLYN